jgi:N-acetylglucosamine kinase-like BadF-type ATPase
LRPFSRTTVRKKGVPASLARDEGVRYVIGVDGGTTKTIALVADERGRILGAGRGGNTNYTGADVAIPMRKVEATARQALTTAAVAGADMAIGMFCLAGADWPEDYERRAAYLDACGLAQRVVVRNDALAGWRGGTRASYGVVIAAGTGTNTCILTPDGREWCYGYYASYGGAVDVGRDAIRAVLREEDGRGLPTHLTPAVLALLNYPSAEALQKGITAGAVRAEHNSALCPLVFTAAAQGDAVAAEIIVRHGLALAEYATAAIRRFGMADLAFDLVLAGSLFKGDGPLLIDTIQAAVLGVAPHATITRAECEPALGAVMLAYDALGIEVTDEMRCNLAATSPAPDFFSTRGDATK